MLYAPRAKVYTDARRTLKQKAEGRPGAATYREAGHAAPNIVLAHYLATPVLNPGLVADERLGHQRERYERRQHLADSLAGERRVVAQLRKISSELDSETGLPLAEALRRARDQVRTSIWHEFSAA